MEERCFDDLDEFDIEITDPLEALEQDNYHRVITPPGRNIDDPDSGIGIERMLSGSDAEIYSLGPRIEAELLKDDRNAEVDVLVTPLEGKGEYDIAIRIVTDANALLEMQLAATPEGVVLV